MIKANSSSTTLATDDNHTHTALIVDDNPTNLGVLSNYLKDSGYRILVARSGESALQKAEYVQPDIILLDVMMPGLDGFETCERLKANEVTKDIPVIFMTALTGAEDKVRGFQVGAVDYITKPLQHEEVLARVSTHLNIRDLTQNLKQQNERLQQTTDELREANTALSKRAIQLETSSRVAQQITSILDLDELLIEVVELIQSQFGYYFVGVWLLNEEKDTVTLQARAGAEGASLLKAGSAISMGQEDRAIVQVCQTGEHYLAESDSLGLNNLPAAQSDLVLPLHVGRKMVGGLEIVSDQPHAFGEEDRILLQSLANQISTAIRNAQLYTAEQQRRQLAESLEETGRVLSSSLDIKHVPGRILDELADVVPYKRGSVLRQVGDKLRGIAQRGYPDGGPSVMEVPLHEGDIFQRITESRRPVLVADVTQDPGWRQLDWLPVHHSWLGVPLISKDRVIGMVSLTRKEADDFSEDDGMVVLAFASQAAVALENAELYDEISQLNEHLEQKVAERTEELNNAYKVLERLDNTKTDFIKVTSHELRTPLTVIKGFTQVLNILPNINSDSQTKELITGIIQGVDRMHQIVDMMLDVVKIDSEVLSIYGESTALTTILDKVYQKLKDVLPERQLSLTFSGLDDLPPVSADPDLLYKAFYNLVVNAVKYTPDGGSIEVQGQTVEPADNGQQEMVEIVIKDTGIGINPEHHDLIFEKFYQTGEIALHSSGQTKFKGGGPGLGLAIVRGIISAHQGQVWVESEGHDEKNYPGSEFHVRLPLEQE